MSLMKSLARVAAGVMLAKGIGAVMKNRQSGSAGQRPTGSHSGHGGLLDSILGNNTSGGSGGSLSDMLGQVLGGRQSGSAAGSGRPYGGANSAGAQGGLGGILDRLGGSGGKSGGLGGILGQLGGGRTGQASSQGGLGDLLGGLLGGSAAGAGAATAGGLARKDSQASNDASFGELFNDSVSRNDEPEIAPTPEQNAVAGLMLKAMIQAAKSDGTIDDAEKQRLLGHLGDDLDDEERQFIREQMAAPVDAQALAREIPAGMESQVYLMSLLAIDFDSAAEARYLHDLAQSMRLDRDTVNAIHSEAGVTLLYS
ncbi:tellurite resistance TerB family protein [Paracoccus sp. YLB-12]|uniref:Tellurite resistance TerB family protein n=1 Tax=Paracoccus maritimus TaxID=2933292 RepID=A0ABT2KDS9_9RHOB|nr:tellurite resistance TerB family protein [Paracoccus sp. YLB-12]MCT4334688.1 tellurite resistance TerB family protein [Paracoccus sp. YLB-12]